MTRGLSLKRSLSIFATVLGTVAVLMCTVLVYTTTELRQINEETAQTLDSVRSAEEAKIALLLLRDETDPAARGRLGDEALDKLDARHPASAATEQVERHARSVVERYLTTGSETVRVEAVSTVDALVALDTRQAEDALQRAYRWDETANVVGVTAGVFLLALVAGVLLWLQRVAFRPVLEVGRAMTRFASGDRTARARERGPSEIREMAVRFNELASALGSQREAQMTFLAGVAHDLKNPVSVLKMSTAIIATPDTHPDVARDSAARMRRQVDRFERMINDLLDTTRIEAGKLEMRFGDEDLVTIAREAVALFEDATPRRVIDVRAPDRPITIACDRLRIEQVVTNLVSNAIKYSPTSEPIEVVLEQVGAEVVLSVEDHGVGISEDDQRRLFEPFRRAGPSKESVPGVGLGLFVIKRIVEAHHGRVEVTSAVGTGSTFRVVLPERQPPAR